MSPSEELEYLKSLVNQLNEKIKSLEGKAKSVVKRETPAQQLRTILVGPPGSGLSLFLRSCDTCIELRVISI
jgi:adenylate kinase